MNATPPGDEHTTIQVRLIDGSSVRMNWIEASSLGAGNWADGESDGKWTRVNPAHVLRMFVAP